MPQQDFFADIALDHHTQAVGELAESGPLVIEKKWFEPAEAPCPRLGDRTYEDSLEVFRQELAELKDKYRPFLQNHVAGPTVQRKSREIRNFAFRYETGEDKADISTVLNGQGEWEPVSVPDYRGPAGRWTAYYRTVFPYGGKPAGRRVYLRFLGVDYIANVYLNGRCIGAHEGFFAAFEFDVTDALRFDGGNVLVVEVRNDLPTIGDTDETINGDKLYAATGLGWDEPVIGWHHCPPGAGIFDRVLLEERAEIHVHSLFVRPDVDRSTVEVRAEVRNAREDNCGIGLTVSIYPFNFEGEPLPAAPFQTVKPAGHGLNQYRQTVEMPEFRLWDCEHPWLYVARVSITDGDNGVVDVRDALFGMRKFHMDVDAGEKGALYLNNRPVILRGANDMGHMQLCVARNDYDQLIEDILIAKLANMNYYRFTQRPVQEEIYRYCDMLGMMNQTDLPLFGYLRRNQFCEALRQTGEMERHIRSHPSAVMISYINEPSSVAEKGYGHRHLFRDELEEFFAAADSVVRVENPDRVIKHVEGDYDPPTFTGLSDFHCYTMWYTNHALPVGKLYKGYLPALKQGWKTGCGEYGTEGLDCESVMRRLYPPEWLPADGRDDWHPERIPSSQTFSMHGDWFEEQQGFSAWIRESQAHQAFATGLMTDALRRRSDRVVSTAVHLLIDAWPSGWMKTLVGVDRVPKPSYFAFQKSLEPVRVNLRCDRWTAYEGDVLEVEAWVLNDTPDARKDCTILATVRDDQNEFGSYAIRYDAPAVLPHYAGAIRLEVPPVSGRKLLYLDAVLMDQGGRAINGERFAVGVFERPRKRVRETVIYSGHGAGQMLEALGVAAAPYDGCGFDTLVASDAEAVRACGDALLTDVGRGSTLVLLEPDAGAERYALGDDTISYERLPGGIFFVARETSHAATREFHAKDFSYWYDAESDCIDFVAERYVNAGERVLRPMLLTYRKPKFNKSTGGSKQRLAVAGEFPHGEGRVICSSLNTRGRIGLNPVLDRFLLNMLGFTAPDADRQDH